MVEVGVEWCASSTSIKACLGGMVRRGLGGGRGVKNSRRARALSGPMVASMTVLARAIRNSDLKMNQLLLELIEVST
jgi:uncharacterized protein YcfJ